MIKSVEVLNDPLCHNDKSGTITIRFRTLLLRLPFILAALWSIGAGIHLLTAPIYSGVTVTTRETGGERKTIEQASTMTLVGANGSWGLAILLIFEGLFGAVARFSILGRYILTAVFSLLAAALTVLGAMTIGGFYFPAVLGLILGWLVLGIEGILRLTRHHGSTNDGKGADR